MQCTVDPLRPVNAACLPTYVVSTNGPRIASLRAASAVASAINPSSSISSSSSPRAASAAPFSCLSGPPHVSFSHSTAAGEVYTELNRASGVLYFTKPVRTVCHTRWPEDWTGCHMEWARARQNGSLALCRGSSKQRFEPTLLTHGLLTNKICRGSSKQGLEARVKYAQKYFTIRKFCCAKY